MKILRYISVIAMSLMFFSFFPFQAGAQDDVKYIGEICYSLEEDSLLLKPPASGRLGVLAFGAGHFVLSGVYAGVLPINGTAFIGADNTFVISLYHSFDSGGTLADGSLTSSFGFIYMVVDATTLKGKYTQMIVQTTPEPTGISTHRGSVGLSICN